MTKAIRSNENLYSVALQNAQKIEKAVALAEQGKPVVDFKRYTDVFTTLVEKMNVKTQKGVIAPKHLKTYQELNRLLQGLSKRIEVVKSGKITLPPANKGSSWTSGWSLYRIAKYTTLGGLALYTAPQLWQVAKHTPIAAEVAVETGKQLPVIVKTVGDIIKTVGAGLSGTGAVISAGRDLVATTTGASTYQPGTSPTENAGIGASFLIQMAGTTAATKIATPFLPYPIDWIFSTVMTGGVVCNNLVEDCSQKAISIATPYYKKAREIYTEHPDACKTAAGTALIGTGYNLVTVKAFLASSSIFALQSSMILGGTYLVDQALLNGSITNVLNEAYNNPTAALEYAQKNPKVIAAPAGGWAAFGTTAYLNGLLGASATNAKLIADVKTTADAVRLATLSASNLASAAQQLRALAAGGGAVVPGAQAAADAAATAAQNSLVVAGTNSAGAIDRRIADYKGLWQRSKLLGISIMIGQAAQNCLTSDSYCQGVAKDVVDNPWLRVSTAISTIAVPILYATGVLTALPAAVVAAAVPIIGHSLSRKDGYGTEVVNGLKNSYNNGLIGNGLTGAQNQTLALKTAVNGLSTPAKVTGLITGTVGGIGGAAMAGACATTALATNPFGARKITLIASAGVIGLVTGGIGFALAGAALGGGLLMAWNGLSNSYNGLQNAHPNGFVAAALDNPEVTIPVTAGGVGTLAGLGYGVKQIVSTTALATRPLIHVRRQARPAARNNAAIANAAIRAAQNSYFLQHKIKAVVTTTLAGMAMFAATALGAMQVKLGFR